MNKCRHCDQPAKVKHLCQKHYYQQHRYGQIRNTPPKPTWEQLAKAAKWVGSKNAKAEYCGIDQCAATTYALQLCLNHYHSYARMRKQLNLQPIPRTPSNEIANYLNPPGGKRTTLARCNVPHCGGQPFARGICSRCYRRMATWKHRNE